MTPLEIAIEIAGWAGAGLILLGYLLISTGRLTGQSSTYHWINLVGAVGFMINGWWHGAIPSAALNVVWAAIAVYALTRLARRIAPAPATPE
ncbi:MAG: hypothetical protein M3438_06225 [Pseudomonadota bacterium]|nr:hypothetical protein [Sphingomonas sp.]MDQ3478738.1 hypothetical protein [Pseudomonadota bacterium]